jgi:predicted nucleotidyltransferase
MEYKSSLQQEIINVLHYFDVFHFPLRFDEIHQFIQYKCTTEELSEALTDLVVNQSVYQFNDIYSLHVDELFVTRKLDGLRLAEKKIARAKKIGKFIQCFPFVRMVAISGSLSKGYADKHSDIDFFIVTNASNLWTCRTFLHLFKKLTFLVGQQHSFCMNYFIANRLKNLTESIGEF